MLSSFLVLIISILFRVFVGRMSLSYSWMSSWVTPSEWIIIGCAALFLIFTVVKIIKAIKA